MSCNQRNNTYHIPLELPLFEIRLELPSGKQLTLVLK